MICFLVITIVLFLIAFYIVAFAFFMEARMRYSDWKIEQRKKYCNEIISAIKNDENNC